MINSLTFKTVLMIYDHKEFDQFDQETNHHQEIQLTF